MTEISGTAGILQSPGYPQSYPDMFSHTWTITVQPNWTIEFTLTDMATELDKDMLVVGFPLLTDFRILFSCSVKLTLGRQFQFSDVGRQCDIFHVLLCSLILQ